MASFPMATGGRGRGSGTVPVARENESVGRCRTRSGAVQRPSRLDLIHSASAVAPAASERPASTKGMAKGWRLEHHGTRHRGGSASNADSRRVRLQ